MTVTTASASRELDNRRNDGVDVSLLWNSVTGELTISVFDSRRDVYFELPARRENALDVFNHPYAYAALLGIELSDEPALAA